MRHRDIIRKLRKLGVPETEIKSTVDVEELKSLLHTYELGDAAYESTNLSDWLIEFRSYFVTILVGLFILYALSFKYPISENLKGLFAESRTKSMLINFTKMITRFQLTVALLILLELVLELYIKYARLSTLLSWVFPNNFQKYLAPMLSFNLHLDPKYPGMNIGPMITIWICNFILFRLSMYVSKRLQKIMKHDPPEVIID